MEVYINTKSNRKKCNNYNIFKLIILIFLLILSILFSFETGEKIYNLFNDSHIIERKLTNTDMARWRFRVVIKY